MLILISRRTWAIVLSLLVLCSSCSTSTSPPDVALKIEAVQQADRPGVYSLSGSTNLPDQSQVTVTAVRLLRAADREFLPDSNANYSILSRRTVEASQGKWQTTLNLWQVTPDGQFQEVWQLERSPAGPPHPDAKVTFLATFDPSGQFHTSQQQLQLKGNLVRFTADGQEYVQASQTLPIALPTGVTAPHGLQAEDLNGGWGNRSLTQPRSIGNSIMPPVKTSQTDAPLSPSQFLR